MTTIIIIIIIIIINIIINYTDTTWKFSGCVGPEIDFRPHLHVLLSTPIDQS